MCYIIHIIIGIKKIKMNSITGIKVLRCLYKFSCMKVKKRFYCVGVGMLIGLMEKWKVKKRLLLWEYRWDWRLMAKL